MTFRGLRRLVADVDQGSVVFDSMKRRRYLLCRAFSFRSSSDVCARLAARIEEGCER